MRRRQALADAAAGITPGEADVPAEAAEIERFRCVIYLCGAPHTNIVGPREECTAYAEAFGWEITDVIEERMGCYSRKGVTGWDRPSNVSRAARPGRCSRHGVR